MEIDNIISLLFGIAGAIIGVLGMKFWRRVLGFDKKKDSISQTAPSS